MIKTSEFLDYLIEKRADDYYDFNSNKKIQAIEDAFKDDEIAKKVAYMIATSHEYKKPNTVSAIRLVKNYKWEKSTAKTKDLQGINKPVNKEKVFNIAKGINAKTMTPLMVVNQFQGIRPQTPGKKILLDGHNRLAACEIKSIDVVPIYKGTYIGKAEKSIKELIGDKNE